jgi:general secretion pathway protein K
MKIFHQQKKQGFAVFVVMAAVTVLTLMAGLFAYSMKVETRLAYNSNNDEQLLWLGRAGMERARWILALEGQQPFSSKNQIWAGGPGAGPETNGPLAGISLENFQVGEGTVSLKFIELESKININTADTPLLTQVLTAMGANAGDISTVSDSIQDWIDTDDGTRPAGAESDYYQGLTPAYYAKNAPMDDLSELLLVKGVTLAMYNGGSGANDQGAAFQHHHLGFGNAPGQEPDYAFGLKDVFTPFSSGQVNLNTADATVLQLIPGMDTESVAGILKWRAGPDGADGTDDDTPFTNPGQLQVAGVSPAAIQQSSRYLTTRGSTYEVHATAQIGNASREFIAVLSRSGPDVHIFSFYWK